MYPQSKYVRTVLCISIALLWASITSTVALQAAPSTRPIAQAVENTAELYPTDDARTQSGSPNTNFGRGHLWVGHPNNHFSLIKFDLLVLPADAQITGAELQLTFTGIYTGSNEVEVGRVDGAWDEGTLIGSTPVSYTWSSQFQTVTSTGKDDGSVVSWNVTPLVQAWHAGAQVNDGLALRGNGGELKAAHSKETGVARNDEPYRGPKLIITYTLPPDPDPARPDLGDAPDSTNHHGQPNTAYPGTGVLGQFPTVWQVPAGQVAGPRHDNQTGEGILGQFISRERDADQGPDQDGPNNIVRNAAGAIVDMADMDRGDDGWRNRSIKFFDCRKQTLTVRISKAPNATLNKMYLNVWFDGNRDGDWADIAPCADPDGGPAQASYEWIVQDYIIDMAAIPPGGFLDFNIDTERVLNATPALPHWMRFTLSEERAVQLPNGEYPDGRGPHPDSAQKSYRFGETEDILQKPPRPQESEEPGELILEKRVITAEDPVDYAGEVTYQIRLRHVGGNQPIAAQIRDQIEYPLHLLPRLTGNGDLVYVEVANPSGGAAPLEADLTYVEGDTSNRLEQLVSWDGTLEPDAEVILSFDVHVHPFCREIIQTKTITNIARAREANGDPITAEAGFAAKCPGYDAGGGIQIDPNPIENPIDPSEWSQVPWQGTVWNKHPISITLGFFQQLNGGQATVSGASASNAPNRNGRVAANGLRFLTRMTLAPNEKRLVDLTLRMESEFSDELALADDYSPVGKLLFCILPAEEDRCADAQEYPNMVGEVPPPNWIPQPEELGDAPDSTNHFAGVAMTAYPGVQAEFPTVFDPATGAIQGPKHRNPRPLHLGPQVSREAEADLGPDADGVNNIWPPANANDQDWFDDGAQLTNLTNCQPARVDVRVAISQPAANWFGNHDRVAYLNVWLDSNHDGDWDDGFTCVDEAGQNKDVVEHILRDYVVDVSALGAGLHTLNNIATERVGWPAQGAQEARWVRFTLSEEPSNRPLNFNGIQYGDGRGYATAFRTGETEDYLKVLAGDQVGGSDIALRLAGRIAPDAQGGNELHLKFDYINLGSEAATGALLTLNKQSLNVDSEIRSIQGPGIQPGDVSSNADTISVALPDLAPNQRSSVAMRLGLPAAQPVMAAAVQEAYTLTAQIDLAGDIDPSNNQASTTISTPGAPLRLAASVESDDLLRKADTTCRDQVWLQGMGKARQHVDLYVNDQSNIQLQIGPNGRLADVLLTNLPDGRNQIWVDYADSSSISPRDAARGQAVRLVVEPGLPVDPITLLLTDSQGRQYHPSTLGWARGQTEIDRWPLQEGETYTMSISVCVDDLNLGARLFMNNELLSVLRDDDGDGVYAGSFTYNSPVQAAGGATATAVNQLRLEIETGGVTQRFEADTVPLAQGVMTDAATGQPVADATVTALVDTGAGFGAITSVEAGEPATQNTGTDGSYGFTVVDGTYRLRAMRSGYQPFRSRDIVVDSSVLSVNVQLSPAIGDPANHIVYITNSGYEPAMVNAKPGDVVMWVNGDLAEHSATGAFWDSGLLTLGESYKVRVADTGTFVYSDSENVLFSGAVVVAATEMPGGSDEMRPVFLPLIRR